MDDSYELRTSRIDLSERGDVESAVDGVVLRVEVRGHRCADHALAVIEQVAAEMEAQEIDRVLVVAAWQGSISPEDALRIGQTAPALGLTPRQRWAVVSASPEHYGETALLVEARPTELVNARVFMDETEALRWLGAR